jgi:hypothetical protein
MFFEKINKIDKPLANMAKMRREMTKSVNEKQKRGDNNK